MSWRIAADIREMFVELAATDGKELFYARTLNRKDLLLSGLTEALSFLPEGMDRSTAAVNVSSDFEKVAVRERWGSPCAFLTTDGFENLLRINTQQRTEPYSLHPAPAPSLIPHEFCFGVTERTKADGTIEIPLDNKEIDFVLSKLKLEGITTVALCFLHSRVNATHEKAAADLLRAQEFNVICSSDFEGDELSRARQAARAAFVFQGKNSFVSDLEKLGFVKSNLELIGEPFRFPKEGDRPTVALTFLEDRFLTEFISEKNRRRFALAIDGLSHVSINEGNLAQIGPDRIDSEPGPVSLGKGLRLSLFDILASSHKLSFEEGNKLKIDEARVLRQLSPLAKHLQMSSSETCQSFLQLAVEMISSEVKTLAALADFDLSRAKIVGQGLLAEVLVRNIARGLVSEEAIIAKEAQWLPLLTRLKDMPTGTPHLRGELKLGL